MIWRYWALSRKSSGSSENTIAPMTLPGMLPIPPRMIMHSMVIDSSNVNSVESMNLVLCE